MVRTIGWALAAIATGAGAQDAPPMLCDAPTPFAAWVRPASIVAADRADRDPPPEMTIGQAATVTLSPRETVRPAVAPGGHDGAVPSYAGLLRVRVPVTGTYRFGLSGPVWLDVIDRGGPAASTAHGHGEPCGPIRKLVDLPLSAGEHVVQLSAAPTPVVTVMAIRVAG